MAAVGMVFGLLAVGLTFVGLYSVVAYSVAHKVREIGLRLALGSTRRRVLMRFVAPAVLLTIVGIGIGIPAALYAGHAAEAAVFDARPVNLIVLWWACVVCVLAGFTASVLPALRATSIDPVSALRQN